MLNKKFTIIACLIVSIFIGSVASASWWSDLFSRKQVDENSVGLRTDSAWNDRGTYIETSFTAGRNILINGSNKYINFNTTSGSSGYGIWDDSGTMKFKNSGGSWTGIGSGSGSGTTISQLGQIGDVSTSTPMTYGEVLRFNTATSEWESVATSTLGLGTVSSVDMSVPTGLSISGNPITTTGTLALTLTSGYSIPTTASQTSWDNKWDLASSTIDNAYLSNSTIGLTSSGSITIGTSPVSLGGTSALNLNMANPNTWTALQTFGNASTTQIGSTGSAYFATTDGNVGIGTTGPGYKLDVNGTLTSRDTFTVVDSVPNNVALMSYSGGAGIFRLQNAATITTQIYANGVSYFNGGNVGIGTSDPLYKLDVSGAGRFSSYLDASYFVATTTTATSTFAGGLTVGTSKLVVDSNGNVGIGTTTPLSKLAVSGGMTIGANYNISGPTNGLAIEGNVGIGTTNPNYKLEVNGTASSTTQYATNLYIPPLGTPAGTFLAVNATGQIIATTTPSGSASLTGTTGQIAYFSGTDTAIGTSTINISTSGIVSIATSSILAASTGYKLNVYGRGMLDATGLGSAAQIALSLSNFNTVAAGVGSKLQFEGNNISNRQSTGFISSAWTGATTDAGGYLSFGTRTSDIDASTEKLRITKDGYIGIATTTPAYFLDVYGNSRIDGDLIATTFIGALTGNASTASALAADPTDCGANTWATTIAANGNLTCSAVTYAGITAMTSANFAGLISDETGTGKVVFDTSPTLITPILGYASSTQLTVSGNTYLSVGFGGRSLTITGSTLDADAELYTKAFQFTIASSSVATTSAFNSFQVPVAFTITQVSGYCKQGTTTVALDERATPKTAGTDILSAALAIGDYANTTSFANASIAAGAWVNLDIDGFLVGSPQDCRVNIKGTVDD